MAAKKKKVRRKAATATPEAPTSGKHVLMVPVEEALWQAFTDYRADRREARSFPWTVRDCMAIAIQDYLEKATEEV